MSRKRIAVIPGDGIGKEVMPEGLRVLEAAEETVRLADVLLASHRVIPRAALAAGFAFRFRELEPALRDVLHQP